MSTDYAAIAETVERAERLAEDGATVGVRSLLLEARAMIDTALGAATPIYPETLRIQAALLDLHPKTENPRHGCCAPPQLCRGHVDECRSREHPLGGVPWPCATLRAAGITSDADAAKVRRLSAAAAVDECTCVTNCAEDPKTACSLSGRSHVHPAIPGFPGVYGPCPEHPDAPGDR